MQEGDPFGEGHMRAPDLRAYHLACYDSRDSRPLPFRRRLSSGANFLRASSLTVSKSLISKLIGREAADPRLGRHRGAGGSLHVRDLCYPDVLRLGANSLSASP